MATATITRIDTGKTGTDMIGTEMMDWRARARSQAFRAHLSSQ